MSFPQTSKTLIVRIASGGSEQDWARFLNDYWLPVCRFAQRRAGLSPADAEDVAGEAFEVILRKRLLGQWAADRSSKLRTLLCTVVRHILSNRARVQQGRRRLLEAKAAEPGAGEQLPVFKDAEASTEDEDRFFASWVEGILYKAVESLMQEYHRTGKGDYFRVLYGRICEGLSVPEIAGALNLPKTSVENYHKAARKRLKSLLEEQIDRHVRQYSQPGQAAEEFTLEWGRIGEYLEKQGGLEKVISQVFAGGETTQAARRETAAITSVLKQITKMDLK